MRIVGSLGEVRDGQEMRADSDPRFSMGSPVRCMPVPSRCSNSLYDFLLIIVVIFFSHALIAQQAGARASSNGKYRISGTVVNAISGEILRNAAVSIGKAQSSDTLQSMNTGEDGGFRFEGLEAGKYWLRGEAKGYIRQAFEEHQGFFTAIVTGKGLDTEHLMFQLRPDAAITGQIVDEANEAVRHTQVILFHRQTQNGREVTEWRSSVQTDDEGRYRFSHLPAGTYFIAVRARPWYAQNTVVRRETFTSVERSSDETEAVGEVLEQLPEKIEVSKPDRSLDVTYPVTYYAGAVEESGATPLTLQAGDRVTADVRLNPVPALHVRIHQPGIDPDSLGVNVMEKIFDGPPQPAQGQDVETEAGAIDIGGIAPGEYDIQLQTSGKIPQSWTRHVSVRSDTELTLDGDTSTTVVKGIVKVEGGGAMPARRGYVGLFNRATGERFNAQVSGNEEFEFSSQPVPAGTYEVEAGGPQDARVTSIAANGAKVSGQNVTIGNSGSVQLVITLRRALATVEGTVTHEGKPVSGAMVVLVPRDLQNNLPLVRRDQSDLDGSFTLRSVVAGKYSVLALRNGWDADWMNPQTLGDLLKSGQTVDVVGEKTYSVKIAAQ